MHRLWSKDDEGVALIIAMIFLVAMGLLATYAASRVANNRLHVEKYVDYIHVFEGVESGLAHVKIELSKSGNPALPLAERDGLIGVDPAFNLAQGFPTFDAPLVTALRIGTMSEIEFLAYSYGWANDGIDNNGDGLIDLGPETAGYFTLYSLARVNRNGNVSARRIAEEVVRSSNVNIWQNAIFAGNGQAGNLINGNVSIHGSVHLLGGDLGSGGVAIAAMDMSGTSLIHNHYGALDSGLRSRIPALPVAMVQGVAVESLNSVLRVKNGLVGMSGNSEIGEAEVVGNGVKETMDAVYVSDGWTGTDMDSNGDPQSVHSDNGFNNEYDLGDAVPFPDFTNDAGADFLSNYLETDAPNSGLQFVHSGPMTISANENYYWDATTGTEVIDGTPGEGAMPALENLDPSHNFVWFEETSNQLVANGRIPIEGGDLTFQRGNGNDKTIHYSGKATFMAESNTGSGSHRNIIIEVDLLARNLDGSEVNSFPQANLLGFMAENDIILGDTAQITIMGGFYAQNTIRANRQTTILGTLVGNQFDLGTNVPEVYQVPELANSWDPQMRMIGANPVMFISRVSWRELGAL